MNPVPTNGQTADAPSDLPSDPANASVGRVTRTEAAESRSRFEQTLQDLCDSLYIAMFGVHPRFDPNPHESGEIVAFATAVRVTLNDERVSPDDSTAPRLVRLLIADYHFNERTARSWHTALLHALDTDLAAFTAQRITAMEMPEYFARTHESLTDRVVEWYASRRSLGPRPRR